MPSILPDYEYDIFISYRQNDNKRDKWVTNFVQALKDELEATLKNPVSIYFDENPHDGLLETHQVGPSLDKKLKCLVFIPIVSQTYCDTSSFAWEHEFLPFNKMAREDELGMNVTLKNGNVASRVLPIQIHELDSEDQLTIENELEGPLRSIKFIHQAAGINRPLSKEDDRLRESGKILYSDQINKVANALKEIGNSILNQSKSVVQSSTEEIKQPEKRAGFSERANLWEEIKRRNVFRATITYLIMSWLIIQIADIIGRYVLLPQWVMLFLTVAFIVGLPIAAMLAWKFEKSPTGFIPIGSREAYDNPFTTSQKKPLSSNVWIAGLLAFIVLVSIGSKFFLPNEAREGEVSIAIIPFRNYTNNADFDNFGFGLADEIRTQLSLSKQFKNISSEQSTIRYHDSAEDPVTIGDALNVDFLILGNFQLAGEKIKVSIEMVDASNGKTEIKFEPFFTSFETYTELFNIQTAVAASVMAEFTFESQVVLKEPTSNIQAFTHYSQGRKFHSKGWFLEEDQLKAIEHFKKATELDSAYLSGWVGLADAKLKYLWSVKQNYYDHNHPEINLESIEKDLDYIEANFDPSWELDYVQGIYYYNGLLNYDKGLEKLLSALEVNPENQDINSIISAIYRRKLELEKSLPYRLKSIEMDPLSAQNWFELSYIFMYNGDEENQEKALLKAWEMAGDTEEAFSRLYQFYRLTGRLDDLPNKIKEDKLSLYTINKYMEERKWQELVENIDSVFQETPNAIVNRKLEAYWHLENEDSLDVYVEKSKNSRSWVSIVLNENEERKNQRLSFRSDMIEGGDNIQLANRERNTIEFLAVSGKYEEATQVLLQYNKTHPSMGYYRFLNDPNFDKIKKSHPPFLEAINQLVYPPKLGQINPMDL